MPSINKTSLVSVPTETMYQVVNTVSAYPEFVEGCSGSKVLEESETRMVAQIAVEKAGFSQTFTTENELVPNQSIHLNLVDGPFKFLRGEWRFEALNDDACKVIFNLEFEFKSKLMGMAFNGAFKQVAESMMQSFINRAKQLSEQG
ncbi:type II toxin-antitoxin system RatA family toxin [Pleionea litopenaei]|uniref:Type II toxin-antitoxin system RatA family toxin n=1 Tax=Pleionea litopenaei TaxID=3070815 RepID=A0AA51X861_9GAMM|nr:type II toxin-antitoxin system RatA family toxin [Pleionea sp. HL-JVS1]WMS89047.1 type II toxin-antitoxin system RatA family toxin [Pleionea sp. HL-JVS1]